MDRRLLLVLTLGIVGVTAKPENRIAEKLALDLAPGTSDTTEAAQIQKSEHIPESNEILLDEKPNYGSTLDLFMEEQVKTSEDFVPNFVSDLSLDDDILYNDVLNRDPEEIMDTAAGFLPVPIIKKRQKTRNRFATRRNFRRNPNRYRRVFFFYPSYGFYPHSSLRYY